MIYIEYTEQGEPVSDFNYTKFVERVKQNIDNDDMLFQVSTSTPITAVRYAIAAGEIDYKKIIFLFNDGVFTSNEYGCLQHWPAGFCDVELSLCEKILTTALRKRGY